MTTKTKQILAALSGGPKTFADIKEALGLDDVETRRVIGYLQKCGYIDSVPVTYAISEAGKQRAGRKLVTDEKRLARISQRRAARKERLLISQSMQSKGFINSVFNLAGGMQL
jgi:hypothetical protein